MPTESIRSLLLDFIESMSRIVLGEPARIVRKREWDRLRRLAYREQLQEAARQGNQSYLVSEIDKNQLTGDDLRRIARRHTPLKDWPDSGDDLLSPDACEVDAQAECCDSAGCL